MSLKPCNMILRTDRVEDVAIITGSSRGICLSVVQHFLADGVVLGINGLDPTETYLAAQTGIERLALFAGDVSLPDMAKPL